MRIDDCQKVLDLAIENGGSYADATGQYLEALQTASKAMDVLGKMVHYCSRQKEIDDGIILCMIGRIER